MGTKAPTSIPFISIETLRGRIGRADAPWIVDVRKPAHFAAAERMIAGALRRPPEDAAAWGPALPAGAVVVAYCVHGHEVSQGVAAALRRGGLAAHYLEGGFDGWHAAGGPTVRRPDRVLAEAGLVPPDPGADPLGHPGAAEDRPGRLPLAAPPLRRSDGRDPFRRARAGARHRQGDRRRAVRRARRGLQP